MAREIVHKIHNVSKRDDLVRDFGLRDQGRRAAVSIMSLLLRVSHAGHTGSSHIILPLPEDPRRSCRVNSTSFLTRSVSRKTNSSCCAKAAFLRAGLRLKRLGIRRVFCRPAIAFHVNSQEVWSDLRVY